MSHTTKPKRLQEESEEVIDDFKWVVTMVVLVFLALFAANLLRSPDGMPMPPAMSFERGPNFESQTGH